MRAPKLFMGENIEMRCRIREKYSHNGHVSSCTFFCAFCHSLPFSITIIIFYFYNCCQESASLFPFRNIFRQFLWQGLLKKSWPLPGLPAFPPFSPRGPLSPGIPPTFLQYEELWLVQADDDLSGFFQKSIIDQHSIDITHLIRVKISVLVLTKAKVRHM